MIKMQIKDNLMGKPGEKFSYLYIKNTLYDKCKIYKRFKYVQDITLSTITQILDEQATHLIRCNLLYESYSTDKEQWKHIKIILNQYCLQEIHKIYKKEMWKTDVESVRRLAILSTMCEIDQIAHSYHWTTLITGIEHQDTLEYRQEDGEIDDRKDLSIDIEHLTSKFSYKPDVYFDNTSIEKYVSKYNLGSLKQEWILKASEGEKFYEERKIFGYSISRTFEDFVEEYDYLGLYTMDLIKHAITNKHTVPGLIFMISSKVLPYVISYTLYEGEIIPYDITSKLENKDDTFDYDNPFICT